MTRFRILYLSSAKSEAFRSRAPRKAPYVLRRSHYEEGPEVSADNPYELWRLFRESPVDGGPEAPKPLGIGDVLETSEGLLLCNFWGFDPAEWLVSNSPDGARANGSGRASSPKMVATAHD